LRIFLELFWFFKLQWKHYCLSIICLIAVAILVTIPPRIVGKLIDIFQQGTLTKEALITNVLIVLAAGIGLYFGRMGWRVFLFYAALELAKVLRHRLFFHFTRMSSQFYQKNPTGDLMAKSTNDITAVEIVADSGVVTFVDSIITSVVIISMMVATISWELTVITMTVMPIVAILVRKIGKELHKRFRIAQAAFSDINNEVQENITGIRVIKSFGQEGAVLKSFEQLSLDVTKKNIAVGKIDALFDPIIIFSAGLTFLIAISAGSFFVWLGQITIGQLTTFTMYLTELSVPILSTGYMLNIAERGLASYKRIMSILLTEPHVADKPNAISKTPAGNISFNIDQFFYPNTNFPALKDVSINIRQGETLGIIGKTGSGKSTLIKLLLREFDSETGDIRIGTNSIYDVTQDALYRSLAYVPQEPFLFSASIAKNIAFARPDASMADIKRVAKIADIHEDVLAFPEGYETHVGERGVTLSGGQKQRISIARALILNTEILILDDALSAVDANTEQNILQELRKERRGKTTIIVSHRLSAIEKAESIIVLDQGKICERGRHKALMELNQFYARMYRQQQLESLVSQGGKTDGN
jgi:ATP-binding cassette, subfamily B, multidrug efflux pump